MAAETMFSIRRQSSSGATQEKSREKGVQGEAKPTRDAEKKDAQTPAAASRPRCRTARRASSLAFRRMG